MTYKVALRKLVVAAGLVAGVATVGASNITIADHTGPQTSSANNGVTGVWGPTWGWKGGPYGAAGEDNETEAIYTGGGSSTLGTVRAQQWDLEGMALNRGASASSGNKLFLVGGYDFNVGLAEGRPGDLFINIGGKAPFISSALTPVGPGGTIQNNGAFDFVVRLSGQNLGTGVGAQYGASVNVTVVPLNNSSTLVTTINDQLGSNPWTYLSGGGTAFQTTAKYYFNATAGDLASVDPSFVSLHGDTDTSGGTAAQVPSSDFTNRHNILELDINWLMQLLAPGQDVGLAYTMGCGNDQLKGYFVNAPEGGNALMLLGAGISALCLMRRRIRA